MIEKEIYVFFDSDEYKQKKSSLLELKIGLINLQKHIKKITVLRADKKKKISLLHRYFGRINGRFEPLYDKIGKVVIPKEVKKQVQTSSTYLKNNDEKNDYAKFDGKIDDFEKELIKIQEQLKQLGA